MNNEINNLTRIEINAGASIGFMQINNTAMAQMACISCYNECKNNPTQLKDVVEYRNVGMSLGLLLSFEVIRDMDTQQSIASIAYYFLSKSIARDPHDENARCSRLLLLTLYHEPFEYVVEYALGLCQSAYNPFSIAEQNDAFDIILKMRYLELQACPSLENFADEFSKAARDLSHKMRFNYFGSDEDKYSLIRSAKESHEKVMEYLEQKLICNADVTY